MKDGRALLDYLAFEMGCECLSDLHYLSLEGRRCLVKKISQIPVQETSLHDWNDALRYLADVRPEATAQAAKMRLVETLSHVEKDDEN